ncbi:hypothetical protein HNV08_01905 [Winogradskyella eckloniae]|uniref:hypothetical protein n=1 Tax=Winogradskyella eckloniae TaxID=1089306 RepID=UPI00156666DB|nr:hypothetical protein [Winogradskyella eckloniae]NRD18787.1 hypothetical protein [Winogradskyella eckloniae]
MSLTSVINKAIVSFCLFISCIGYTQVDTDEELGSRETSSVFGSIERQKFVSFSVGYHIPISSGNNFVGSAYSGKSGYDLRLKLYVYKQFFMEYNNSISYFSVDNNALVGNYNKSKFQSNFLYFGYEFLPAPHFRLGVNAALFGETKMTNTGFNLSEGFQNDSGQLSSYGLYLAYEIQSQISLYIDYAFRTVKTNIRAPQEIESFFSKGNYNTIGVGIMFLLGKRDFISRFTDKKSR